MALLTNSSNEFAKLHRVDKLVCLEILLNRRSELGHYVKFTARNYLHLGIKINADQLLSDLNDFEQYAATMDHVKTSE